MCAALYLLSADRFLWGKAISAIEPDIIHFQKIHIHSVDLNGYVLFHTAKDLYQETKHISLSELVDLELVGDMTFVTEEQLKGLEQKAGMQMGGM